MDVFNLEEEDDPRMAVFSQGEDGGRCSGLDDGNTVEVLPFVVGFDQVVEACGMIDGKHLSLSALCNDIKLSSQLLCDAVAADVRDVGGLFRAV